MPKKKLCYIIHIRKFDIQVTSGYDDMLISFEFTICVSNTCFHNLSNMRNQYDKKQLTFDLQNALIETKDEGIAIFNLTKYLCTCKERFQLVSLSAPSLSLQF